MLRGPSKSYLSDIRLRKNIPSKFDLKRAKEPIIYIYIHIYIYIYIYIYINVYIYLPTSAPGQAVTEIQFFKEGFCRFKFRVFVFLDWLPNQVWRTKSALVFMHSLWKNNWIYTFPKGISSMWNAVSTVLNLNSYRRVRFLQR